MSNSWDDRYGTNEFYYGTEPNDFLKAQASAIRPGGKVLCLAEGEGRNAVYLASLGFQVTAVDGSARGLEKLAKLAGSKNVQVKTVHSDLADFEIASSESRDSRGSPGSSGEWDGIVSIWCHLPPALRKKVHRDCVAGLKSGGVMILESYTPKQLEFKTGGPPVAELMMTLRILREELAGLEFVYGAEIEREVQEGRGHHGKSAVVEVLARKS